MSHSAVELSILRARVADAAALTCIAISAKRHWNYPDAWIESWLPQLTVSARYIQEHETWLATENEIPVAFYSLRPDEGFLWLDHLWVSPGSMDRGIGGLLFRHALGRARMRGVSILRIESDPHAQGFYEKMGARKMDEQRGEVEGQTRMLPVMEIQL